MPSDLVNICIMNNTDDVSSIVGTTSFTSSFVHCLAAATTSTPSDEGTCEMDDCFISVHPFAEEYKLYGTSPLAQVQLSGWTSKTNHIYWAFMKHFTLATACSTL